MERRSISGLLVRDISSRADGRWTLSRANDRGDAVLYAHWETPFQRGEPDRSIRSSQDSRVRLPQVGANCRPLIPTDWPHDQADLVKRMLIKNPTDRIRMRDIRVRPSMATELIAGTPMGNGTWCRGNDYKRRQFVLCRTTGRGAYSRGTRFGYSAQEGHLVSFPQWSELILVPSYVLFRSESSANVRATLMVG
jgi:hypothetical protein